MHLSPEGLLQSTFKLRSLESPAKQLPVDVIIKHFIEHGQEEEKREGRVESLCRRTVEGVNGGEWPSSGQWSGQCACLTGVPK